MKPWAHIVHGFFMCKGFANSYLLKYRNDFSIEPELFLPLDMVVVIPCCNEPGIKETIQSLFNCNSNGIRLAVVVVVNSTLGASQQVLEQNHRTVDELAIISRKNSKDKLLSVLIAENLPYKHGGVGWARKIGMDWAVTQFNNSGNKKGIIVSLDADAIVDKNYIQVLFSYFSQNTNKVAATIYFEHHMPDECKLNNDFELAITTYELYMRYYKNALLSTGFPVSIYTVGSCFAVRVDAYIAQGGMNRRKAGEDFYFLHKLAMLGEIGEINTTTVFPSGRISDRVPFGTGPVVKKFIEGDRSLETTYPLRAFLLLKPFFDRVTDYYSAGDLLSEEFFSYDGTFLSFARENNLVEQLRELASNCGSYGVFQKRFFHLFNAFMVLKWLNYSVLATIPKEHLICECQKLLVLFNVKNSVNEIPDDPKLMLNMLRQIDRERTNY